MESKAERSVFVQNSVEFAEPEPRKPLVLLRDTERTLRLKTVETLTPLLPEPVAMRVGEASLIAEESLEELAKVDFDEITDEDLRTARMTVGILLVAFGALAMAFLLLFLYALYPNLDAIAQVRNFWYQYVWVVCLGISGLFMVGREAMRPVQLLDDATDEWDR